MNSLSHATRSTRVFQFISFAAADYFGFWSFRFFVLAVTVNVYDYFS